MTEDFDPEVDFKEGEHLFSLGMYDEAIEAYDRAMEIDPDYALACIEKGLEMDPLDANVWSCNGLALYSLGRYEEAVKAYDW